MTGWFRCVTPGAGHFSISSIAAPGRCSLIIGITVALGRDNKPAGFRHAADLDADPPHRQPRLSDRHLVFFKRGAAPGAWKMRCLLAAAIASFVVASSVEA